MIPTEKEYGVPAEIGAPGAKYFYIYPVSPQLICDLPLVLLARKPTVKDDLYRDPLPRFLF